MGRRGLAQRACEREQHRTPCACHAMAASIFLADGLRTCRSRNRRARAPGCYAVLVWGAGDLAAQISALTDGRKAEVVYDPIGRAKPPAARHVCVTWRGIGGTPCDRGR